MLNIFSVQINEGGLLFLLNRLASKRVDIFTFPYHPDLPPDNNDPERVTRNVKVKQKKFRKVQKILSAAEIFAILRSILDNAIINFRHSKLPVLNSYLRLNYSCLSRSMQQN
jgi:hypothetical protein